MQSAEDKIKDINIHCQRLDPDEKEVYSHETRQRCGKCFKLKVFSVGTLYDGTIKRWKCRTCKHTWKTNGKKI